MPLIEVYKLEGSARYHPDAVGCVALSCRGCGMTSVSSNGVLAVRNWRRLGGGLREWIWRYSALPYLVTVRDELRGARDRLFFLSWVVGFQVVRKSCE